MSDTVIIEDEIVTVVSVGVQGPPGPGLADTDDLDEGSTNLYYTEERVSANTDVAANTAARHTHANQAVLDATTASFTTADETKLDGIEAGATGDQLASEVPFTANGDIAATNVQAAVQEVRDDTDTKLALKAPLASPALTGAPTVPTAAAGTNTNQLASTAFVKTEVANLINSAPTALDTLNELAAALGNDANFATTVTNSLALKAPLASPGLTGVPTAPTASQGLTRRR